VSTSVPLGKSKAARALRPASFAPAGRQWRAAFDLGQRRVGRAQQKHARETHAFERLTDDPRLERVDVGGDVRKLRHPVSLRVFSANPLQMQINGRSIGAR
jgi:hypothetical protein